MHILSWLEEEVHEENVSIQNYDNQSELDGPTEIDNIDNTSEKSYFEDETNTILPRSSSSRK